MNLTILTGLALVAVLLGLVIIVALTHARRVIANPRVDLKPAKMPLEGQRLTTVLTAEDWQFFAFIFVALLTLGFAIADDLMEAGGCRLAVKGGWSVVLAYLTLLSHWGRVLLLRALPPFKRLWLP